MGPLLWDIEYDGVLGMAKPRECEIVCYADDTMTAVGGWGIEDTIDRTNRTINMVVKKTRRYG